MNKLDIIKYSLLEYRKSHYLEHGDDGEWNAFISGVLNSESVEDMISLLKDDDNSLALCQDVSEDDLFKEAIREYWDDSQHVSFFYENTSSKIFVLLEEQQSWKVPNVVFYTAESWKRMFEESFIYNVISFYDDIDDLKDTKPMLYEALRKENMYLGFDLGLTDVI